MKLNKQGTPNISSEITLIFENGSQTTQFGQILISELYIRAKPIVIDADNPRYPTRCKKAE